MNSWMHTLTWWLHRRSRWWASPGILPRNKCSRPARVLIDSSLRVLNMELQWSNTSSAFTNGKPIPFLQVFLKGWYSYWTLRWSIPCRKRYGINLYRWCDDGFSWFQFQVPGFKFQVLGSGLQVPRIWKTLFIKPSTRKAFLFDYAQLGAFRRFVLLVCHPQNSQGYM